MTYEQIRAGLAEKYGWTFDVIDNMSFDAIESALVGTKKRTGLAITDDSEVFEMARNWRRYYQGLGE